MTRIEVGVQGRQVVLLIGVPSPDGKTTSVTRLPLEVDEARDVVNGMGEAIKHLSGVMADER